MDIRLEALDANFAAMGRGVVLISVNDAYVPGDPVTIEDTERWTGTGPLLLAHLGNTEGDIAPSGDVAESELTFPEYTGPIAHRRYYDGESLTLTVPLFFADPRLRAICSPTGRASGGYSRQRPVREHTVVVIPEQAFFDPTADAFEALTWVAGTGWRLGGSALTTEQQRLLDLSVWIWRCSWGRQFAPFAHADGGKTVVPCECKGMHAAEFPDGNQVYTLGDPADSSIELDGLES